MSTEQQIEEILTEANAYGLRTIVDKLANEIIEDIKSDKISEHMRIDAYQTAYNISIQK